VARWGGPRQPPARTPPGGPGRFSRRSERTQPIREPDLDRPDIEYGQRQMLTEAQRIAPVPRAPEPRVEARPRGEPALPGRLPSFLFEMPTAFPEEPATAGLDIGPGPGSEILDLRQPPEDVREQVLEYLAANFGNADAKMMLAQMREERARAALPQARPPAPAPSLPMPVRTPTRQEPEQPAQEE